MLVALSSENLVILLHSSGSRDGILFPATWRAVGGNQMFLEDRQLNQMPGFSGLIDSRCCCHLLVESGLRFQLPSTLSAHGGGQQSAIYRLLLAPAERR